MAGTGDLSTRISKFIKDKNLVIDVKRLFYGTKISEGASSTVYKGSYDGNPVAIKMLQSSVIGAPLSQELKKKFAREVMLLYRGRHDKVVRVIGASMESGLLIVTELMTGDSLRRYLWRMRPHRPALQDAIKFALDISRAMEYLHSKDIIHRDLKPGNLVLESNHKSLKVADLGLSQVGDGIRHMNYEPGNTRWMAPEMFTKKLKPGEEEKEPYDRKVDVYSFSIVLWELLTNETPSYKIPNRPSLYHKHLKSVPVALVQLLETCWAEKPTDRPEFTAIIVQLSDILNSLP